jgi:pimeloyl-ACP methyl ester carboxylesterase
MKQSVSHYHDVRGLRYHVRAWGDPGHPPLILLHGWMDVAASFQFLVDQLDIERYIVAPDWRGFGLTAWAPGGYWFPDYYADLDRLLDIYSPDAPVDLLGHSMGGNAAVMYAGMRPARIARLITLEGIGMPRQKPDGVFKRYATWLDQLKTPPVFKPYRSFDEVAARLKRNNPRLGEREAAFLAQHWARETSPGQVELVSDPRHKMVNPYAFRLDEALACCRQVTAPVLLVTGSESEFDAWLKDTPAELAERKAAFRAFTEARLEGAGHMMHHDRPAELAALIRKFLGA